MDTELVWKIKELAQQTGYVACGITTTEPFHEFEQAIENRMKRFPEAAHLYAPMKKQMDHCAAAPWARAMIVCVRRYGKYVIPDGLDAYFGRYYLFDQRNPACSEYSIRRRFEEGLKQFGLQAQQLKVPFRWAGARAGVTRFGRNCFAYAPEYGSWVDIHTWGVDVQLLPDTPTLEIACPEGCRMCIEACPTHALVEPFVMRRDHCIAYLTYWAPEPISPDLWERMGSWIYGCDVCQRVCPQNKQVWKPLERAGWLEAIAENLSPAALATMDMETYRKKVYPHFWYIAEDDLARWHANANRALQQRAKTKNSELGKFRQVQELSPE